MPAPESLTTSFPRLDTRVFYYSRTGLNTVVCQLRFDPILRIGQEMPVVFQDRVRSMFPKWSREQSIGLQFVISGIPATPSAPPAALQTSPLVWRFKTEDDAWTGGLSVDYLSLETSKYSHFADFESHFNVLRDALQAVYEIQTYVRVGLRYINLISSSEYQGGLLSLFSPALLGPLADPVLGSSVRDCKQALVLADEDWTITVQHGLESRDYRLDLDHATEGKIVASSVPERLRAFNLRLYQVFRWAISDSLHEQMGPTPRE